uniref:Uncharacterized protein n=1 Tax=Mustela putorius furo TaxID=9669 RepID=M3Y8D2_MUSPF
RILGGEGGDLFFAGKSPPPRDGNAPPPPRRREERSVARGPSSVRYVCTRREETCVESARPRRRCGRPRDTASLLSILSRRGERADTALNPELQEEVQVPARAQTGARSSSPPCAPDFGGAGRFCLSTRRPDPRGPAGPRKPPCSSETDSEARVKQSPADCLEAWRSAGLHPVALGFKPRREPGCPGGTRVRPAGGKAETPGTSLEQNVLK